MDDELPSTTLIESYVMSKDINAEEIALPAGQMASGRSESEINEVWSRFDESELGEKKLEEFDDLLRDSISSYDSIYDVGKELDIEAEQYGSLAIKLDEKGYLSQLLNQ